MDSWKGVSFEEACSRLKELLHLYFHAAMWTVDWCRLGGSGADPGSLPEFCIHEDELDCLRIDREELLSLLIAGGSDNPWVRGTARYHYATYEGRTECAQTGVPVDGTHVEDLYLRPNPLYLPDRAFIKVLRDICCLLGRDHRSFLFRYHESAGSDPLRLVRMFYVLEGERSALTHALNEWHFSVIDRINHWREDEVAWRGRALKGIGSGVSPVAGLKKYRREMALFLHCSTKTLKRWEAIGHTPDGHFWPQAKLDERGMPYYEMEKCWDTIREIMPQLRDRAEDAILREEILCGSC